MGLRSSDRHLDAHLVSRLIADQFADLAGSKVRPLGSGWDHDLFEVGPDWIFRFPRRAEGMGWLSREIEIMAIVADTMGSMVPRYERLGEPTEAFANPFVGYRRLHGVAADQAQVCDPDGLAGDVARLFGRLHRIDPARIPPTPGGWEHEPWSASAARLAGVADTVRPLLGHDLCRRAEPYLAGVAVAPAQAGPLRFVHNDICPDHLLVDADSGRLTGLVDFTDAMVGDPVLDFVGLIGVGGRRFIDQVVAHYELALGDDFGVKFEWLTRVLTLTWLADAVVDNPDAIAKHLTWVERAFAD